MVCPTRNEGLRSLSLHAQTLTDCHSPRSAQLKSIVLVLGICKLLVQGKEKEIRGLGEKDDKQGTVAIASSSEQTLVGRTQRDTLPWPLVHDLPGTALQTEEERSR